MPETSPTAPKPAAARVADALRDASTHPGGRLTVEDRAEIGKAARKEVPRSSQVELVTTDRPDAVELVAAQNDDRLEWLVPVRHGRMMVSPFTFYRGAACLMAGDLARTADSGMIVQAGGDAHLSNFGVYASPERTLVFDQNDFDESLPGPWEWDIKRLATSFTIAAQHRGFDAKTTRAVTAQSVASYRTAMADFAAKRTLDLWYDRLDTSTLSNAVGETSSAEAKRMQKFAAKAQSKDSLQALHKLAVEVDGQYQIASTPPVLLRAADLPDDFPGILRDHAAVAMEAYAETLPDDRHHLFSRFTLIDVGLKVVGVGSVGTRCLIALFEGRDRDDPFFLQIKEAGPSVLEDHLPPSRYEHSGRRVVEGQRLTQAASDIFLGWTTGPQGRPFYVRQLRDWKGSADIETSTPEMLQRYAKLCGWTLARGHARTGDAVALSAYLGTSATFDKAVTEFAEKYAAINDEDYQAFIAAIEDGRLEATPGV